RTFFFSSRRRHTRSKRDWSSDVCSSDLIGAGLQDGHRFPHGGAGGDDVLDDNDAVAVLGGVAHCAAALAVVLHLFAVEEIGLIEIGRASCRERVWGSAGAV